jgi:hypothetical protein
VHVAERDEGVEEAARRRARQAGRPRDLAETELAVLGVERADDRQAPLEGLDVVSVARRAAIGRLWQCVFL